MKQFCEKDQQISAIQNIVTKITKMLDEAELKKKKCEQINKLKEEIKKETDSSIGITKKEILELLEKINREKWIIGEYKWMPIGSCMPTGWFKVAIAKGHTLVQGDELGIKLTSGMVKKHNHFFNDERSFIPNYRTDQEGRPKVFFYDVDATGEPKSEFGMGSKSLDNTFFSEKTSSLGETLIENNLAAGLYAELWQYKGVDYKKKCLNSCIHRYVSQLINKFENCKKDQMKLEFLQPEEKHTGNCC